MSLSNFWCKEYSGYNSILRKESILFRRFVSKMKAKSKQGMASEVDTVEVWEQCVHMTTMERWKGIGKTSSDGGSSLEA